MDGQGGSGIRCALNFFDTEVIPPFNYNFPREIDLFSGEISFRT
jgi:hypothetical protein